MRTPPPAIRVIITLALGAAGLASAILLAHRGGAPRAAVACTGGFYGPLEMLATSPHILLADVVVAGDGVNRAPTIAPTQTATVTVAAAAGTPQPTPVSPPVVGGSWATASVPFDVTGYGATLRVVESYAGSLPETFDIDTEIRAGVERSARYQDDGAITDCAPGQFAYRYETGARYLVFAGDPEGFDLGLTTFARLRVDGDALQTRDLDVHALTMRADLHARFFAGIPFLAYEGSIGGEIAADHVPLDSVLRAIAATRDPASGIQPPDAGSAGLK